ncbi:hypothetical protein C7212DRAFT_342603 [Tuber magnatum]|uniref:Uncharacterized protein n=1 Tax=Tuber magnatum TaxID=42249 RepID=A0A317ST50_9PEZI|nr:hypothetical protein C7212DRAFT_342603 [Tuber magnatum]
MVTGLVYTKVDGNGDHRDEIFRVKRSLARGAQSIRRMRVRNSANPKTAYANEPGCSLPPSIQQMENQILALQKKTEDYEEALKVEGEARKEATEALEEKTQALTHEVTILHPLKGTAIDIQQCLFATYRGRQDAMRIDDPYIIDSGNLRAHAGDVILDIYLFKNHLIGFEESFSDLYGSEQLVDDMNARATGIKNPRLGWSFEQEAEFRNFVNATTVFVDRVWASC